MPDVSINLLDSVRGLRDDASSILSSVEAILSRLTAGGADAPGLAELASNPAAAIGYRGDSENRVYRAFVGGTRPFTSPPAPIPFSSTICQQVHFSLDQYRFWCEALKDAPRFLRKQWEFVYIAQALYERGMLTKSTRGLAYGVGQEPLPSLFASFGAEIVASDQSLQGAIAAGWVKSSEYSIDLSALNARHICTPHMFAKLVSFAEVDMNAIPAHMHGQFDFCWSACALEHLGSLQAGLDFIVESIETLKPGGVAVHTTEYNLSSNDQTIEHRDLSIYRRKDIEELIERLTLLGHHVEPVDWTIGEGAAETVVDLPPYGRGEPHLRLDLHGFCCTSIGIIVRKSASA